MKAKFLRSTFVFYQPGELAIIDGTYATLYGQRTEDSHRSYAIFPVKDGHVIDHWAWIPENELTAFGYQNQERAEEMIEEYQSRGWDENTGSI